MALSHCVLKPCMQKLIFYLPTEHSMAVSVKHLMMLYPIASIKWFCFFIIKNYIKIFREMAKNTVRGK